MTETIRYPAERVRRLIIAELAADAQLLGAETTEIEIQFLAGDLSRSEALELDDDVLYFQGGVAKRVIAPEGIPVIVGQAQGDVRVMDLSAGVQSWRACRARCASQR